MRAHAHIRTTRCGSCRPSPQPPPKLPHARPPPLSFPPLVNASRGGGATPPGPQDGGTRVPLPSEIQARRAPLRCAPAAARRRGGRDVHSCGDGYGYCVGGWVGGGSRSPLYRGRRESDECFQGTFPTLVPKEVLLLTNGCMTPAGSGCPKRRGARCVGKGKGGRAESIPSKLSPRGSIDQQKSSEDSLPSAKAARGEGAGSGTGLPPTPGG